MTIEDKELAVRFMEGGEASFHELYVRHAPTLLAFIRRLLGRRSD